MDSDYDELIHIENLFRSWRTYRKGKGRKADVMEFERHLEDNLFDLHRRLKEREYVHDEYSYFRITDPKKRDIYKSTVRDRIVHQALYTYLCRIYEPLFIEHSFSSRKGKGVHKGVAALFLMAKKQEKEKKRCLMMKCDIRKYFESIDHGILLEILRNTIRDERVMDLLETIVDSFCKEFGRGIPLGNITSQIFANVYLNELDRFVLSDLGVREYVRYNDDFIIMGNDRGKLFADADRMRVFLSDRLSLELPEKKMTFRKFGWGVDFCGSIVLPNAILLRNKTKGRMFEKLDTVAKKFRLGNISSHDRQKTLDSYFGLLSHCKSYDLRSKLRNDYLYMAGYQDMKSIF